MTEDDPVILVVDDEPSVADLYTTYLEDAYAVRTAYDGNDALDLLDERVDVALLDRRLVEWSGDELVTVIKDRKLPCQIAMVTAVAPDFDIADLAIDAYLTKPVSRDDLLETVEELVLRSRSDVTEQELLALISRKLAIEHEKSPPELATNDQYAKLERRIALAEERLHVTPQSVGSKYRPDKCHKCNVRWDLSVGDAVGFVRLSSFIWKCTQCGNVQHSRDPYSNRLVRR